MKRLIVISALVGMILFPSQEEVFAASSYEVRDGDSLWTISQKYGVTVDGLKRQNNLAHFEIYPEQQLSIPSKGSSVHTVQPGETLWIIANHYGVHVSQLRQWNGFNGSMIYPGQSITIAASFETVNQKTSQQSYKAEDRELLARLVHAESKGESYKGKAAVAAVVLNRVKHEDFPSSIAGVIYETYSSGNIYAFEPVQNGEIRSPADTESVNAVNDALNGYDPTNGAIYFFNPETATSTWVNSLTISQRIGNHVFAK